MNRIDKTKVKLNSEPLKCCNLNIRALETMYEVLYCLYGGMNTQRILARAHSLLAYYRLPVLQILCC